MTHVIVKTRFERVVFEAADGRILGSEVRIDTWMVPFEKSGRTTETESTVATAGPFYDMAEAGRWVEELRAAQDVERARRKT